MSTFRCGLLLGAAMLLLSTASEAMPVAPLNDGTTVTQVARQAVGAPTCRSLSAVQCAVGAAPSAALRADPR